MLNGPVILSTSAIFFAAAFIFSSNSEFSVWGGKAIEASPEWTPAYSMCSEIMLAFILPFWATASSSISLAFSKNLDTVTGYSWEMRVASWM